MSFIKQVVYAIIRFQLRPYMRKSTGSRPIPEVKHAMARSVVRWETTREYRVQ